MRRRNRRVLVLRTSRFVGTAIAGARLRWPDADIRVLYQDGSEADLLAARVAPDPTYALPGGQRVTPASLLCSRWGWRALMWRPDDVVVQWWNSAGHGHAAATWTALLLQVKGIHAVIENADWIRVTVARSLWRPVWQVLRGALLVLLVAGASALAWPATEWFAWRERRRLS